MPSSATSATQEQLREMQALMMQLEPRIAERVLCFTRSVARARNCCRPKTKLLQRPEGDAGIGREPAEQALRNFAFGDAR